MRHRILFPLMWILAVCCSLSLGMDRVAAQDARPNVVIILADDLGWADVSCYGGDLHETPHIDRLAGQGVRFTDAYAAAPVCTPTRAALMTGKYPARMGTTDYFGAPQPETAERHWTRHKPLSPAPYVNHLPLEEVTLAEALREQGYATFFAGIPTMYRMLLEAGPEKVDLTSIRCWGGGADSFSDELIEEFRELAARKKWIEDQRKVTKTITKRAYLKDSLP